MSQKIKSVFLAGLPAIVIATFLVAVVIYGWTEPGSPPPAGNVSAPINVGGATQYKSGALTLGSVGGVALETYYNTYLATLGGNVGIGTAVPEAKLHITGTPGVDGIKFPDGSMQTTASAGTEAGVVGGACAPVGPASNCTWTPVSPATGCASSNCRWGVVQGAYFAEISATCKAGWSVLNGIQTATEGYSGVYVFPICIKQ